MTADDELYTIKLTRKELLVLNSLLSPTINQITDIEKLADKIIDALWPSKIHDV